MRNLDLNDTIAAIGTAVGESGIGIVRLSGKDALAIADKIFVSKDGKKPTTFKTYTTHYGWVAEAKNVIDEVILTVMRAPRSYTKEDIVEINCHGGIVPLRRVLDLVLAKGARLAEPGEFTKRAFLNGRIDLAQAEAVLDIIRAKTDAALKVGTDQLKGALSGQLNKISKELLDIHALLEANIDFPEEETGSLDLEVVRERLKNTAGKINNLLLNAGKGKVLREGISAVICGKPNVGKSSLLNALLKQERSIVTPVAGTTRDTIEEIIDIQGIPVRIVDTAGIIQPRGRIEEKAVARAKQYIRRADLVILLFDGSRILTAPDQALMRKLKNKTVLAVINKIDLKQKIDKSKVLGKFPEAIEISAKKLKNIGLLEEAIAGIVSRGKVAAGEPILVSKQRHIQKIRRSEKLIAEAVNSLHNKLSLEFIAQSVSDALRELEEVLGKKFSEGLLNKIFSEFCIGK